VASVPLSKTAIVSLINLPSSLMLNW
jgi:hypothetical protein